MKKNLFIVKRIIEDKTISDEAFTVWCGLRNIMAFEGVTQYFVSYDMIAYSVFNRVPTRRELDAIKRGYTELKEKEYINELSVFDSKTGFIVDLTALYYKQGQEYFANLRDDEMHKIMNIDTKQSKYKLLRYFACQVGTFNQSLDSIHKGKVGGMSLDCFVEMLGYSVHSIITYNDILLENEILFVYHHGDFYQGSNRFGQSVLREISNTYARYEDENIAMDYIRNTNGYKHFQEQKAYRSDGANKKRALGQKLNCFRNGTEYDIETIK